MGIALYSQAARLGTTKRRRFRPAILIGEHLHDNQHPRYILHDDTSISCEQKLNKCGKANEATQILPEMCGTV